MFGIVLSALYAALAWLIKSVLIKFAVFFGLFFVTTEFVPVLISMLPNSSAISSAFNAVPPSVWYFFNALAIPQGVSMLLAAYVTRFTIRRIPLIG